MPRRSPRICGAGCLAAKEATLKSSKAGSTALLIVICLHPLVLDGKGGAAGQPRHPSMSNLLGLLCYGFKGVASWLLKRPSPVDWRMMMALVAPSLSRRVWLAVGLLPLAMQAVGMPPSVYALKTRPVLSTVRSLKSSRFLVPLGHVVPWVQITPSCTASLGVASTVNQVRPPL